ncbi:MAG: RHS repeat domain-containing protein [Acutalibacteraceae bacterium]
MKIDRLVPCLNKMSKAQPHPVSSVPNLSGASQYVYDELGQLVREVAGSTTYEYAYDSKGNISSRKTYSNGTLTKTDTFTYGADSWEDRLTGYGNKTIAYDEIGNPTSYLGATLTWRGRELAGYSKGNKQISYSYDVDGMRYRKTVTENNDVTAVYDYVYSDGKLILLTYTANGVSNTARFIYDSLGDLRGFILNNTAAYIYLKNAQGDITAIVDENGQVLLTYSYTAWGKVTYSATSMESLALAATLSNVNPFTYRGYCYDYDIGMYYLQSRYYDPEICRFINADSTDYLGATGTLLSYNLFAYCENDGVNYVDVKGCVSSKIAVNMSKCKNVKTLKKTKKIQCLKNQFCVELSFSYYIGTYNKRNYAKLKYYYICICKIPSAYKLTNMEYSYGTSNVFYTQSVIGNTRNTGLGGPAPSNWLGVNIASFDDIRALVGVTVYITITHKRNSSKIYMLYFLLNISKFDMMLFDKDYKTIEFAYGE